ncbi:MAG: ATP-binding protein [Candidatus Eisenbacteria bacterium]
MNSGGRHPSIPRIEVRFTLGLVLATLLAINVGGWVLYHRAKGTMEAVNGKRLITAAEAVAAQIDPERVLALRPGDEGTEEYRLLARRLARSRDAAGLDNVFLFEPYLGSLADARPGIAVGEENPLIDMDSKEMAPLWQGQPVGLSVHEIDGERFQSAFVPLLVENELRAVLGVDASAEFLSGLETVREGLLLSALLSVVLAGGIGLFVHRNARRLVALQGEIKNAEKLAALGTLTAGLAHEIRNPLAIIRGSAELLAEEEREKGGERGFASQIVEEVDRMSELVDHFLEFAKPASPRIERADLVRLVRETAARLEPGLRERGVRMRSVLPDGEVLVPMDRGRIAQVLLNLIANARDAVEEERGEVEIALVRRRRARPSAKLISERGGARGYAEVRVTDTGKGIPDAVRSKLFDPFFTTKKNGTGLGLSIVHGIVKGHEGYVFVENGKERGASVGFGLPL